jgi:NAD(P)-dependent dehydrogenase (short-subunit alcohol dehydrogenase family)
VNRAVVIIGASAGIERALAVEFGRRAYRLGLTARRMGVLEEFRQQLQAMLECGNRQVELASFEVTAEGTVALVLRELVVRLGGAEIDSATMSEVDPVPGELRRRSSRCSACLSDNWPSHAFDRGSRHRSRS